MLKKNIENFFLDRRNRITQALEPERGILLLPGNPVQFRNPDVEFPFRQESNFYYLTGFDEPNSYLVIYPSAKGKYQTALFVMDRNVEKEIWEGERYGLDRARDIFKVDQTFSINELGVELPKLAQYAKRFYFALGNDEKRDREVIGWLKAAKRLQGKTAAWQGSIHDPDEILSEVRLIKSTEEIHSIRKACEVSALAHKEVLEFVRPGMNESEVEAFLNYRFRTLGCQRLGYESIIAGGRNATCLHYRQNNEPLVDGSLLLIDAGGEHNYYTADITRTFPVGTKFSPEQKKIYSLVLKAQKAALAEVKPGSTQAQVHNRAVEVMVEGLLELGLLKGKPEEIIKNQGFKQFYPHGTGHWLGMDVHDIGSYLKEGVPRSLQPGMIFTVEPGLYIQPDDATAPQEYRGIGVRIEDDVLVTESGHENLTSGAPKEIQEIESLREKALQRKSK